MDQWLAALVTAAHNGTSWKQRVEAFQTSIGSLVGGNVAHGRAARQQPATILRESERLAVEVTVWRPGESHEIAELLTRAGRSRVRLLDNYRLVLLLVLVGVDAEDARYAEFGELTSGFDAVVIGTVGEKTESWVGLRAGERPEKALDLPAAVRWLNSPRPAVEHAGAAVVESRGPRFMLIGDEWGSANGGLSTVNRELAVALADAGIDVRVYLPEATETEIRAAKQANVQLVVAEPIPGLVGASLLLGRPALDDGFVPEVIIGHGRHLGPYAYGLQRTVFPNARRVHVMHTDPERLEAAKEVPGEPSRMMTATERTDLEVELAVSADLVVGVGPLLTSLIRQRMRGQEAREVPPVFELLPGLHDWHGVVDPADPPPLRQVLLVARAEDVQSKGIDIAISAVRKVAEGHRDSIQRPELIVRGVPPNAPDKVRDQLKSLAGQVLKVVYRPFVVGDQRLRRDLWGARVVIMPSRHEGFGLAAYEAMAAGVPVLISRESGLAHLLQRDFPDEERIWPRETLPVWDDSPETEQEWATAIERVLTAPEEAFGRAAEMRDLIQARVSWGKTVAELLDVLGY
jgi:glycosyltransferase involved in cell wall biosynthesis